MGIGDYMVGDTVTKIGKDNNKYQKVRKKIKETKTQKIIFFDRSTG